MKNLTHDQISQLIDKYREKATELYQNEIIKIEPRANVQLLEEGAFVECVVWVPFKEIK